MRCLGVEGARRDGGSDRAVHREHLNYVDFSGLSKKKRRTMAAERSGCVRRVVSLLTDHTWFSVAQTTTTSTANNNYYFCITSAATTTTTTTGTATTATTTIRTTTATTTATTTNSNPNWRGSVSTGEEPPRHSWELMNHALSQVGGPTQTQLSRPMSSGHHISTEQRTRRKQRQLKSDTDASNEIHLEEKRKEETVENFEKKKKTEK